MRPVSQTIIDGERGDCERACVATITGIPIEEIPNFADPDVLKDHTRWMREWLHTRGFGIIEPKRDTTPFDYTYTGLHRLAAIATVPSQMFKGGLHAIVVGWRDHPEHEGALECYVVHDPNPNNGPYRDVGKIATRLRWIVPHMLGVAEERRPVEADELDIVFDGPPGPEGPRFVEVEIGGRSVRVGSWVHREDGFHVLRLTAQDLRQG